MFVNVRLVSALGLIALLCQATPGLGYSKNDEIQVPKSYQAPPLTPSDRLRTILMDAVRQTITSKANFKETEIAATLIDLREGSKWQWGDFRGEERIYPASVIKMLYMAALERQ